MYDVYIGRTLLGMHEVLVIPNAHNRQTKVEGSAKFLRVVHASEIFDIMKGIHVDELKHSGYKVMDYVQQHYHGITRGFIQEYCKHCPACQLSQPQVTRPPLRPIITRDFLERVQVDLIDMRHSPAQDQGTEPSLSPADNSQPTSPPVPPEASPTRHDLCNFA